MQQPAAERNEPREEWKKRLSIVRVNRSECIIKVHRSLPLHFNRDHLIFYVNFSSLCLHRLRGSYYINHFFGPEMSNFSLCACETVFSVDSDWLAMRCQIAVVLTSLALWPRSLIRMHRCTDSSIITSEMFICALPFYSVEFDSTINLHLRRQCAVNLNFPNWNHAEWIKVHSSFFTRPCAVCVCV